MPYENFDIVGDYNKQYSAMIDDQTTDNYYLIYDSESPKQKALVPIPGSVTPLELANTDILPDSAPSRACFLFKGQTYWVIGNKFITYDLLANRAVLGSLATTKGYVGISANLSQIMVVDGAYGYIWDGTDFSTITDASFPVNPHAVTYLDGRFVVSVSDSNQFFQSQIEDGKHWDALQFARLTTQADTIVNMSVIQRRIFIFGHLVTEIWYDVPNTGFVFGRDNNFSFNFGCLGAGSVANDEGYIFWLANTKNGVCSVKMTQGAEPEDVSPPEINLLLQSLQAQFDLSDAQAYIIRINGVLFYLLSFTAANITLLYNHTYKSWTTMSMLDRSRYFGSCHVFFDGKHFVGQYNSPNITLVSSDYTSNFEGPIRRERTSVLFRTQDGRRIGVDMFEVQFRQGLTPNDIENPVVYLSISTDGGKTWGFEIPKPLGKTAGWNARTVWNALGIGDSFIFRVVCYQNIELIMIGANINYNILRF